MLFMLYLFGGRGRCPGDALEPIPDVDWRVLPRRTERFEMDSRGVFTHRTEPRTVEPYIVVPTGTCVQLWTMVIRTDGRYILVRSDAVPPRRSKPRI